MNARRRERGWDFSGMNRKYKFKLSAEQYAQVLTLRAGGCAVCARSLTDRTGHLDHDHSTGELRGWLCASHNNMIGKLRDDVEAVKTRSVRRRRAYHEQETAALLRYLEAPPLANFLAGNAASEETVFG